MKHPDTRLLAAFAAVLLLVSAMPAQQKAKPLTVEGIFAHGAVMGTPPSGLAWSPDGQHLTYLDGGELIDLDPGLKKPHILVSRAKLATLTGGKVSEQDRDHRERYGMASYIWAPDSKHLMFDSNGSLWIYDLSNGTGVDIGYAGEGSGDDPKFSPNGEYVSFIRNHGLAVVPLREVGNADGDGGACAESSDSERRSGLGVRGGTRYQEQLLLVAGFEEPGIFADDRGECSGVSDHRLDPDACVSEQATISAAGRSESGCAGGGGERKRRQGLLGSRADRAGAGLHSAIRMGRSQDAVGGDAEQGSEA